MTRRSIYSYATAVEHWKAAKPWKGMEGFSDPRPVLKSRTKAWALRRPEAGVIEMRWNGRLTHKWVDNKDGDLLLMYPGKRPRTPTSVAVPWTCQLDPNHGFLTHRRRGFIHVAYTGPITFRIHEGSGPVVDAELVCNNHGGKPVIRAVRVSGGDDPWLDMRPVPRIRAEILHGTDYDAWRRWLVAACAMYGGTGWLDKTPMQKMGSLTFAEALSRRDLWRTVARLFLAKTPGTIAKHVREALLEEQDRPYISCKILHDLVPAGARSAVQSMRKHYSKTVAEGYQPPDLT